LGRTLHGQPITYEVGHVAAWLCGPRTAPPPPVRDGEQQPSRRLVS